MKLKTGDEILITAGKDKGRRGKIEIISPKTGRVLVPGVNIYKKHQKGGLGGQKGGIFEISRPLLTGNIALICPNCHKQTRVGYKILKSGEKVRICQKCTRQIDKKNV